MPQWGGKNRISGADSDVSNSKLIKPILLQIAAAPCLTQRGFSLIEVVVAVSILAIGILATMQMGLLATRNITSGNIVTQAVLHAQGEIERIKAHGSLANVKELFPEDPLRHGYFQVSYNFVDPLAEEIEEPGSINCATAAYDGSGSCLAEVRVSWMRGGGGRGGRGQVVLKTMFGEKV